MAFVGYIRVSHVGGRGGESFRSPDDQRQQIEDWARRVGERVEFLAPELDGKSDDPGRPILREAIEGVESGRWEGIVFAYLSRAWRNTRYFLEMCDRVEAVGASVVFVQENLDTSTPAGRMQRTFLAAIAEHDLDSHRERFAVLREKATAAGVWQRRQTPLGYDRDTKTRRLVPSKDAPRVVRAFADRLQGKSLTAIAQDLQRTPSGVRQLLRNRVYLGELRVGDFVNTEAHPPIVDVGTFEAVQAMRQARPMRSKKPTLLAGLVRCQSCGHVMRRGTGGGGRPTYSCHGTHSLGRCPQPTGITSKLLEDHVIAAVRAEIATWDIATTRKTAEADAARGELAKAENELSAFLEAVDAAGLGIADYAAGARSRREAVDDARARLDTAVRVTPITAKFSTGADVLDVLDVEQLNRLLRGLVDAVVVAPAGRGKNVPVADRVRIFTAGTLDIRRGEDGITLPIEALPFPPADDERLVGILALEDGL